MARRIAAYFVYANGEYEGETKTLAGARRMAGKVARIGMRPEIRAAIVDGDRSWNEPIDYTPPQATRAHATIGVGGLAIGDIVQRSDQNGKNRYVIVDIRAPWIFTQRIRGSGGPGTITFPSALMLRKVA